MTQGAGFGQCCLQRSNLGRRIVGSQQLPWAMVCCQGIVRGVSVAMAARIP
jgi:hypothetical protein